MNSVGWDLGTKLAIFLWVNKNIVIPYTGSDLASKYYMALQEHVPWDRNVPSKSVGESCQRFLDSIHVAIWPQAFRY